MKDSYETIRAFEFMLTKHDVFYKELLKIYKAYMKQMQEEKEMDTAYEALLTGKNKLIV